MQFVFIHGVGGAKPIDTWLEPLNARLAGLGYPRVRQPSDAVSVADYGAAFAATTAEAPRLAYERLSEPRRQELELEYVTRQLQLQRIAQLHSEEPWRVDADVIPNWAQEAGAFLMDRSAPFFREVKLFLSSDVVRDEACRLVAEAFPSQGSTIVVAHSLGSLVASRALQLIPREVTVDLLITIGSPLSFERYRNRAGGITKNFPFGQVKSWLNVYSPRDVVCAGRGISSAIGQAVDACARIAGSHDLRAYMSHPAVAGTIGHALSARIEAVSEPMSVPVSRTHPVWYSDLLRTAFTYQVAEEWKSDHWDRYLRLQQARQELARRTVERIEQVNAERTGELDSDDPWAPGRVPNLFDLTDRSAQVLRDVHLQDDGLLVLAVALLLAPLVPPFDFEKWVDPDDRRLALEHTFNLVRDHGRSNLTDGRFAQQIVDSLDWARDRMKGPLPIGRILIGVGLVALAATGIGLTVAAPAGLGGAAAITATLASFGPGGMVGGVATLAALTGTAGALTGIGLKEELSRDGVTVRSSGLVAGQTVLAKLEPEALGSALVGMLAVVYAQSKLGFETTEPGTRDAISGALDDVSAELRLHHAIAPGAKGTDRLQRRVEFLNGALEALDQLDLPHVKLHRDVRDAVTGVRALRSE